MGRQEGGQDVPHLRIGYFVFGLVMANIFYGVLVGRGKDRNFYSKSDQPQPNGKKVHAMYNPNGTASNDVLLEMYHNKASAT